MTNLLAPLALPTDDAAWTGFVAERVEVQLAAARRDLDTLKIAKAFVDELGSNAEQERLVAAILRLSSTLGIDTVAEGIEDESQRDRLRSLKCRYGQGYFFSRPVPAHELDPELLRARVA